jgi:hypothetical protein
MRGPRYIQDDDVVVNRELHVSTKSRSSNVTPEKFKNKEEKVFISMELPYDESHG